jgi:hypothetical protein
MFQTNNYKDRRKSLLLFDEVYNNNGQRLENNYCVANAANTLFSYFKSPKSGKLNIHQTTVEVKRQKKAI